MIMTSFAGRQSADMPAMTKEHPLYDDYWASKRIRVSRIDVIPVYLTASYSSMLHGFRSFQSFLTMKTRDKWFRVHPHYEWHDLCQSHMNDDLHVSVIGRPRAFKTGGRKYREYVYHCLLRSQLLHLNASALSLQRSSPTDEAQTSYLSHDLSGSADFTRVFQRPCELSGIHF